MTEAPTPQQLAINLASHFRSASMSEGALARVFGLIDMLPGTDHLRNELSVELLAEYNRDGRRTGFQDGRPLHYWLSDHGINIENGQFGICTREGARDVEAREILLNQTALLAEAQSTNVIHGEKRAKFVATYMSDFETYYGIPVTDASIVNSIIDNEAIREQTVRMLQTLQAS